MRRRLALGDPFWPAQLTVAIAIALNFVLSERVTVGPTWLAPSIESVLLVVLVVVAPMKQRATEHSSVRRRFALGLTGFVSLANVASLALLVKYLLDGGKAGGHQLILSGVALLATNVLLFAVWFWELDRGGPVERFRNAQAMPDFQFPQMENPQFSPPGWRPSFLDYLYTSLTNATAFSPTDVLPLTHAAKAAMALQSITSLTTIALVLARAVNILA